MGNDIAIHIEGLGKQYQLGEGLDLSRTFRETVMDLPRILGNTLRSSAKKVQAKFKNDRSDTSHFWALRDINLDIKRGEVTGVIGRNGAGKSTLFKVLSRITTPSAGFVDIYGRVGALLEVGTGFHQELTGRENIYLNGVILGMRKAEIDEQFDKIVAFSETEKFLDTPVKRYSSGMRVRLGFAVAAHLAVDILIVDEVLSVGDASFREKSMSRMESVSNEGKTVLFVSHNMSAIRSLCKRVILLDKGQVVLDGPTEEVISTYLDKHFASHGEQVWPTLEEAPGDDVVRLRSVRLLDPATRQTEVDFSCNQPLDLEIEYEVLKPDLLTSQFQIRDLSGNVLFFAGEFQDLAWKDREHPVGTHRAVCHLPANFFTDGSYTIDVNILSVPHLIRATQLDALSFRVNDDYSLTGARGYRTDSNWPTVAIRPKFEYSLYHNGTPVNR
ncbi:MAG TPA: ABC transporter ATP-binding protein [Candidatus Sumerlaeota bacterium]|nr:ABC transporter ATP-binding protein [Candidatus Sumerlaeota bacterium]